MNVNAINAFKSACAPFKGQEDAPVEQPKVKIAGKEIDKKVVMSTVAAAGVASAAIAAIALARRGKTISLEEFAKKSGQFADDCSAKILNKRGELKDFTGKLTYLTTDEIQEGSNGNSMFRFVKGKLKKAKVKVELGAELFRAKTVFKKDTATSSVVQIAANGTKIPSKTTLADENFVEFTKVQAGALRDAISKFVAQD